MTNTYGMWKEGEKKREKKKSLQIPEAQGILIHVIIHDAHY